jgi:hypothetical protein
MISGEEGDEEFSLYKKEICHILTSLGIMERTFTAGSPINPRSNIHVPFTQLDISRLSNAAYSGGIWLIQGPHGIGKTSHLLALKRQLIQEANIIPVQLWIIYYRIDN